jgi:hypothetical protein
MMTSTFLAVPFVPVFYVLLERMNERLRKVSREERGATPSPTRR